MLIRRERAEDISDLKREKQTMAASWFAAMIDGGILPGSGHNALVLACYAARACQKVAVAHPPGSGFKHNARSFSLLD